MTVDFGAQLNLSQVQYTVKVRQISSRTKTEPILPEPVGSVNKPKHLSTNRQETEPNPNKRYVADQIQHLSVKSVRFHLCLPKFGSFVNEPPGSVRIGSILVREESVREEVHLDGRNKLIHP